MREVKPYESMDDIVASVAPVEQIEGVYASVIEEDVGLIELIRAVFISHWSETLVIFAGLIFGFGAAYLEIPEVIFNLIISAFVLLYLYLRGKRLRPSVVVVTNDKVYLIDMVLYDIESKTLDYGHIDVCKKNEIGEYFKVSQLNPLYHLYNQHFRMKDKKYIISRGLLPFFIFRGHYPTAKFVSFFDIKSLLHKHEAS